MHPARVGPSPWQRSSSSVRHRHHLSVPVRLGNGEVYGTLCCFGHAPVPTDLQSDLNRLRAAANLIGVKVDQARAKAIVDPWRRIGEQLRR